MSPSKFPLLLKMIAPVVFCSALSPCAFGQTVPPQPNWGVPVFEDDFNPPSTPNGPPNSQYWAIESKKSQGQGYDCAPADTANGCDPANPNVFVDSDGYLNLVARKTSTGKITTGRLKTASLDNTTMLFSTQYGRVEARIKLPVNSGNQGMWPAFWMQGANINAAPWPLNGEIDIMEYIGKKNPTQIYSTLHYWPDPGFTGVGVQTTGGSDPTFSDWHVYGAIWSPNQVSFYLDDPTNIYGTFTTANVAQTLSGVFGKVSYAGAEERWPFDLPFYLILDLNVGNAGSFPGNTDATTTYPQVTQVDWVKVYHAATPAAPSNVAVTAVSSSQANVTWTASPTPNVTYNVYRSTVSGTPPMAQDDPVQTDVPRPNQTLIASGLTGTSYADANLAPGQQYFYFVTSSGLYSGEGVPAQQATITLPTNTTPISGAINVSAAGYAGSGTYLRNPYVSGGSTSVYKVAYDVSSVTNPAPQDVYRTERWGAQTWVVGHLSPGGSYALRMHFAESAFAGVGQRLFNVAINGQVVLPNVDIYGMAGALDRVVTQTITAVADTQGMIVFQLQSGAAGSAPHVNPEIRALDITPSTGGVHYGGPGGSSTYAAINSGGPLSGNFAADPMSPANAYRIGPGDVNTTTQTISTAGVTNPAPADVYQTELYGQYGYLFQDLIPNKKYTFRLHFAEGSNFTAGDRLFNVAVDGNQILTNFDVTALAGLNQAYIKEIPVTADEFGQAVVQLNEGAVQSPSMRGFEVVANAAPTPVLQVDAGGAATGTWVADTDFSGGSTSSVTTTVDTSHVNNPAPMAVYQSERRGTSTYTLPGLTPGATYTLNLHFAETYWKAAGKRLFNITLNGASSPTVSNYDVFQAAGGANIAVVKPLTATATSSGTITVKFTSGTADIPMVSGIEVVQ